MSKPKLPENPEEIAAFYKNLLDKHVEKPSEKVLNSLLNEDEPEKASEKKKDDKKSS